MNLSNMFLSSLKLNTSMGTDAAVKQTSGNKDSTKSSTSFEDQLGRKQMDYRRKSSTTNETDHTRNNKAVEQRDKVRDPKRNDRAASDKIDSLCANHEKRADDVNASNKKPVEKATQQQDDDLVHSTSTKDDVETALTKEQQEALVAQLAQNLGVSVDEVTKVLQEMKISPEELCDGQNMKDFIQKLKGIADPLDLLSLPDLKDMMDKISKTLTQFDATQSTNNSKEIPIIQQVTQDVKSVANEMVDETAKAVEKSASTETATSQTETKSIPLNKEATAQLSDNLADTSSEAPVHTTLSAASQAANSNSFTGSNQQSENATGNQTPQSDSKLNHNLLNEQTSFNTFAPKAEANQAINQIPRAQVTSMLNQIAENIKMNVKFDTTELSMNLKPEALGNITLRLLTTDGKLTAQFLAENSSVKEAIENNLSTLRNSLKEQGINVESISVEVHQDNANQDQMQFFQNEQQKSERRIKQIIEREGMLTEEAQAEDLETQYVNPYDVSYSSVDYTA